MSKIAINRMDNLLGTQQSFSPAGAFPLVSHLPLFSSAIQLGSTSKLMLSPVVHPPPLQVKDCAAFLMHFNALSMITFF